MEPIRLPGMNRTLNPPPDWDEEANGPCDPLHVFADVPPGAGLRITSAWQPNEEELAALNRGCAVALTVFGGAIPPMSLGVFEDPAEGRERKSEAERNGEAMSAGAATREGN